MRSRLGILIKKELLLYYGMRNPKKEPNPARFLLLFLILFGMSPALFVYVHALGDIHGIVEQINQLPAYFMLLSVGVQMAMLFTGVPAFLGRFYGNRDNSILLPMPIEPGEILIARFIPVLVLQLLTALAILIPGIFIHAVRVSVTPLQWLNLLAGSVASVIFPTAVSAVLVLLVMRFTNFGKHADKWKTIGILLMLFLLIGVQVTIQNAAQARMTEQFLLSILTDNQTLIRNFATIFFPARWTGMGMSVTGAQGLLYAGLNLILTFLSLWVLQWLGTRVYLHSLLTGSEMSKEKKKEGKRQQAFRQKHPILQVLLTEWRTLLRTPAFAVNVLSTPLIVSVVWLIPLVRNDDVRSQLAGTGSTLSMLGLSAETYAAAALLLGGAVGVFLSLFTETSTSFSREGQAYWIRRVLPIQPSHEIIGRSLLSILLSMGTAAILMAALWVMIRYPLWLLPIVLLSAAFFSLPLTLIGLYIDVHRPKMNWDDPNQAVKQNLNSLIAFVAAVLYIGLLALIGYVIFRNTEEIFTMFQRGIVAAVIVNAALSFGLYILLLKHMPVAMAKME